jgi:hypothetical protein
MDFIMGVVWTLIVCVALVIIWFGVMRMPS